jgi:hypothetical protein
VLPLVVLIASGCSLLRSAKEPLSASMLVADNGGECVLVMLPGLGDSPSLFSEHGFHETVRQSQSPCDVVVVDSPYSSALFWECRLGYGRSCRNWSGSGDWTTIATRAPGRRTLAATSWRSSPSGPGSLAAREGKKGLVFFWRGEPATVWPGSIGRWERASTTRIS